MAHWGKKKENPFDNRKERKKLDFWEKYRKIGFFFKIITFYGAESKSFLWVCLLQDL